MNTIIHTPSAAKRTAQVLAAATAIIAGGLLTIPAPAQASPPSPSCNQYVFNGDFPIRGKPLGNGANWTVSFSSTGPAAGMGQALVAFADGGRVTGHVVSGGGIGGRNVNFRIQWDDKPNNYWFFNGIVGDDGLVHGGGEDLLNDPHHPAYWDSTRPLDCFTPAAPPSPAPAPPAPAQQPAPPNAQPAAPQLGVSVNGPTTLPSGLSGTYNVPVSNSGDVGAPVELFINFHGQLQQTDQITASGGFDCTGTTVVHCTVQQLPPKATANIVVHGWGSAPGAGHLSVNINSAAPGAQFVQKSQQLNVSIT